MDTKTPGGAKGFGTRTSAVARYYLIAEYLHTTVVYQ